MRTIQQLITASESFNKQVFACRLADCYKELERNTQITYLLYVALCAAFVHLNQSIFTQIMLPWHIQIEHFTKLVTQINIFLLQVSALSCLKTQISTVATVTSTKFPTFFFLYSESFHSSVCSQTIDSMFYKTFQN